MLDLPIYITLSFGLTILLSMFLFCKATAYSKTTVVVLSLWLVIQSVICLTGFYAVTDVLPPRFIFLVAPPLVAIVLLFATSKGKKYMDGWNVKILTLLHVVRIPVELILFQLFLNKAVPEIMTFEGRNFDIISGISSLIIFYFGYVKNVLSQKIIMVWNIACLLLLLNIVFHGVLSVPYPFQQFGFEQPNIALLHFPFIFLPGLIVPLVLLSHLVSIRYILKNNQKLKLYE
ncbi:MAG: hypothetical protein WAQ28_21095 [Bacteroidia bacterium]